jgi:signal transduction histidine kinase
MINAVQAMHNAASSGGAIAPKELIIRTVPTRDPSNRITAVQVHVIDTGPGIPQDVFAKIFTPYFTTKAGGSGLGLPTTRRLIEAHGGRLEVFTDAGKGTDFVVTLAAEPTA